MVATWCKNGLATIMDGDFRKCRISGRSETTPTTTSTVACSIWDVWKDSIRSHGPWDQTDQVSSFLWSDFVMEDTDTYQPWEELWLRRQPSTQFNFVLQPRNAWWATTRRTTPSSVLSLWRLTEMLWRPWQLRNWSDFPWQSWSSIDVVVIQAIEPWSKLWRPGMQIPRCWR